MMRSKMIAVIGCIGSGKTTFSKLLGEEFPVYSADILAKEVLETKRAELVARYGTEIYLPNRIQDEDSHSPENDGDSSGQNFEHRCEHHRCEHRCEQTCKLNKEMLAGILFQENEDLASEERRWIAELVNEDVLSLILSYSERSEQRITLVEITAPTSKVLQSFDGVIVIKADEETSIRRTNDRESAWSEERRRKIYRMQMENISLCIEDYLSGCEANVTFSASEAGAVSGTIRIFADAETPKFVLEVDNSDSEEALKKSAQRIIKFLRNGEIKI